MRENNGTYYCLNQRGNMHWIWLRKLSVIGEWRRFNLAQRHKRLLQFTPTENEIQIIADLNVADNSQYNMCFPRLMDMIFYHLKHIDPLMLLFSRTGWKWWFLTFQWFTKNYNNQNSHRYLVYYNLSFNVRNQYVWTIQYCRDLIKGYTYLNGPALEKGFSIIILLA